MSIHINDKHKKDFPIFSSKLNSSLVYLDSAATTFKPNVVIEEIAKYYTQYSSNIHRGLYPISILASEQYEKTRETVRGFINASKKEEVIFTKGATEGLNLLASSLSKVISTGSEIVATIMDHHANFVPWQQVAVEKKFKFGIVTFDPQNITLENLRQIVSDSITSETSILLFHTLQTLWVLNFLHKK